MMPGASDDDPGRPGRPGQMPRGRPDENAVYRSFSTTADEVIDADQLCDSDELGRLRHLLDQQLSHLQSVIARLANRLQRRLLAKQTRAWEFDLEEGISMRRGSRASSPTRSCRSPTSANARPNSAIRSSAC